VSQVTLSTSDAEPAGRRERNKQRTREALIHAAMDLFAAKGYEHTAIREITDAVDVSERTFFRYFASKEDLVMSFVRDESQIFAQTIAARPPDEEPFTAIRNAYRDTSPHRGGTVDVLGLIDATPSLRAASMSYFNEHGEEIVRVIADREGVDPETDPRPRVLLGVFGMLAYLANKDWRDSGGQDAGVLMTAFDRYADQVLPALTGHWKATS